MPELPEVETTLNGIKPHIVGQTITDVIVRYPRLRWPIPINLKKILQGQIIQRLWRRGKYILFAFSKGTLILHLGMSGRVRILAKPLPADKHDHVDIHFANKKYLRFTDPRRFGALLWTEKDPQQHPLLANMGLEPLTEEFSGEYLWQRARKKKVPVKSYLMNGQIVAGVGNIYATEALFQAHIRPQTPAGKIKLADYQKLAAALQAVLKNAIAKGGTTLKDFTNSEGSPGYFHLELKVYGHEGEACPRCGSILKSKRIGQRSSVYCAKCQK